MIIIIFVVIHNVIFIVIIVDVIIVVVIIIVVTIVMSRSTFDTPFVQHCSTRKFFLRSFDTVRHWESTHVGGRRSRVRVRELNPLRTCCVPSQTLTNTRQKFKLISVSRA